MQFTHWAAMQGGIAASNALMPVNSTVKSLNPYATFTDPEAAHVGLSEQDAQKQYGKQNVLCHKKMINEVAVSVLQLSLSRSAAEHAALGRWIGQCASQMSSDLSNLFCSRTVRKLLCILVGIDCCCGRWQIAWSHNCLYSSWRDDRSDESCN